jgi:GDPmannose 4,6-dehydratase
MKRALISGITGQDGSYLAEFLLAKGYEVHGIVRPIAQLNQSNCFSRIEHIRKDLTLHHATLDNFSSIAWIIFSRAPFHECYHLAAQSFVGNSFLDPFSTMNVNVNGTHYLLQALLEWRKDCRFYFAASSEMFGKADETRQCETTRFHPRSPYGISKCAGFDLTRLYREAYGMFACSGICFNHESPRRGDRFVTRKIAKAVAAIKAGRQKQLVLGNMEAIRDWGYAPEYVEAMWLMLQQNHPDDFVIATGEPHTVKHFCMEAFSIAGLDWEQHTAPENTDQSLFRPAEVDMTVGDASKARKILRWQPKTLFKDLVRIMVEAEMYNVPPQYDRYWRNPECAKLEMGEMDKRPLPPDFPDVVRNPVWK